MASIRELNKWANAHTYYPIDILRIAFGIFLVIKGMALVADRTYLNEILASLGGFGGEMLLIHYVALAHMGGGVMIIIGLLTRWSLWVQLPIIVGAFAINFIGIFNFSNFIQATLAILVCVFFLFYGSGKHSADYYLKMEM
jgi:putative oxidoreductase